MAKASWDKYLDPKAIRNTKHATGAAAELFQTVGGTGDPQKQPLNPLQRPRRNLL
jgi:hypothetical protein